MEKSLLFSIATDKDSFVTNRQSLRKVMTAKEIYRDVTVSQSLEFFKLIYQNSTAYNFETMRDTQKTIGRIMISIFQFFIIENKTGFEILAGEAL